jgi:ribosomal protein S18 acetylase RimI-like enzyme
LTSAFVAPWARGRGLGRDIVLEIERLAKEIGLAVLNLDLRDTQRAAIRLYQGLGYIRWGTHPVYAQVEGRIVPGHYYYKLLEDGPAPR